MVLCAIDTQAVWPTARIMAGEGSEAVWSRQVPRLTWKWGGRTDPLKSGILSSEANPEKILIAAAKLGT